MRGLRGNFTCINTKPDSRDKYLIEMIHISVKYISESFTVKGKRGVGAKWGAENLNHGREDLVKEYDDALSRKAKGSRRGLAIVFQKVDRSRALWAAATQATAMLDALGALVKVSSQPGFTRPEILDAVGEQG